MYRESPAEIKPYSEEDEDPHNDARGSSYDVRGSPAVAKNIQVGEVDPEDVG